MIVRYTPARDVRSLEFISYLMLRRTLLALTLTIVGCGQSAASAPAVTAPVQPAVAPDTVIDGYLIGLSNPACERAGDPHCTKILALSKIRSINTAGTGVTEVVGLAEEAMLSRWPDRDPAAIVGLSVYDQSQTGWKDASGAYVRNQSAPYYLVVFDFADGMRHVAGVVCGTGECWAHGPDDLTAPPPVDVVSSAGQEPMASPS
jgi:hypothetical protein